MSSPDETIVRLLYISRLAPGQDFGVVKDIFTLSRHRNPHRSITGALLFDGERFCQLLEGPTSQVDTLMRNIRSDPRHVRIDILGEMQLPPGETIRGWWSGYCDATELDLLDGETTPRGPAAIQTFISVLREADVE